METSAEVKELMTALCKAQGAMAAAKKDSTNPHFKSSYADLASVWEACRAPLTDNGLSIIQVVTDDGGRLSTRLCHSSGEWVQGFVPVKPMKQDMQAFGSALTYARRYGLMAMVGIAPDDDDDGNAASAPPQQRSQQPKKPPAKQEAPKEPPQSQVVSSTMKQAGVKTLQDANLLVCWLSQFARDDEPKFENVDGYKGKAAESQRVLDYFTRAQESGVALDEMLKAAGEWDRNQQAMDAFGDSV